MPVCLYCRAPTTGAEGAAHLLPEAIVANDVCLPAGTICDKCNNYFSKLDSALANHPMLAFGIQAFGLPGKRGKPRVKLGHFEYRGDGTSAKLSVQPRAIKSVEISGNRPLIALQPPQGEALRRFHRSLYYVAFNLMVYSMPVQDMLRTLYDPVRTYIRRPAQGEVWPYCHAVLGPKPIEIIDLLSKEEPIPHVVLRFFNHAFAVDPFHTSTLHQHLTNDAPVDLEWTESPYNKS